MTEQEFRNHMEQLIEAYPGSPRGANWPKPRVQAFWDAFGKASGPAFAKAIQEYIANHFTPPSVDKLRSLLVTVDPPRFAAQPSGFQCEPCRDFGFVWEDELIVACGRCQRGRTISPATLAKEQKNYDRGKRLLPKGQDLRASINVMLSTPINPQERSPVDRSGEW